MSVERLHYDAYQSILAQHQELKGLLAQIDRALSERNLTVSEVGDLLGQLGDRLVKHFATEEEGGYFAEALASAPQLLSVANRLLAQHPKMSARARDLVVAAQTGAGGPADWWETTTERFRAFCGELLRHETQENVLLQEAYGRDIGPYD